MHRFNRQIDSHKRTLIKFSVVVSLYFFAFASNVSANGNWIPIVQPPETGSSRAMLETSDGIYVGTSSGLYFSANQSKSWQLMTEQSVVVSSLIETSNKQIMIGTYRGGLKKFSPKTKQIKVVGITDAFYINGLVSIGNTLFATSFSRDGDAGVYFSKDNGDNWLATNFLEKMVWSLSSPDGKSLYAGTQSGLFVSTNLGETWLKVNEGIDEDVVVSQVVIVNNQLLAATGVLRSPGSGIFKFNDDTNNWQKYGNGLPARTTVNSIALFDEKLVASTATFGELKQGLYLSDDSGATWKAKSFENKMGADILLSRSGDILVSTEGTGVWRSGDLETWSLASEGIRTWDIFSIYQTKDRDILAASENGIWRFSSQSSKWLVPDIQLGASSFELTANNQILSTAENNLLLGDENGTNWERIPIGGQYIFDLYIDSDRWYALDIRQPVKYSDDQGKTWQVMSLPEEQPARSIIKTANGDLLASNTSGIFRSTDNAKTWVLEIEDMYVWNFAKTSKGQLFASVTGLGMKRSDDNGKSWQDINIGFGEQPIRSAWSIAITNDSIYIAAYNRGFFQSKNNGESWQSMSKGLKGPMALSLYLDKNGKLYGGTSAGIYFWQE